ncbi:MAG TPA: DegQ family serine endoprotease [Zoogloea sp.]|uniref:DegQ family serine endoprotease n=1 Tax=Zoogloea sp. TaxID=49181 RepID=UPI002C51F8C6|nr:DegQ family serine endoprotease [Zoogloea sp.]HMV63807.1 DegQ family serine endoprotease [Rhodocyclaceae bacterium]HMY50647.1 DegQ family serine endoprotease [Rhodocyclaceae bacterium]HNA68358.1 DegQ family serine endoprotease [Rhodocyclaceae bacterium]HNB66108.1 DegQ family serine endoprotease [Rhodocyclaceae bacterium]HNC78446.1 DegQ family serine endoprotease [Rhodocyclaceae bacterium]
MKSAVLRYSLAASAIAVALAGCLPEGAAISSSHAANATSATAPAVPAAATTTAGRYGLPDFSALVEQVGPAVVNISVTQKRTLSNGDDFSGDPFDELLRRFGIPGMPGMPGGNGGGRAPQQIQQGVGSGFIVSGDGYVLTNAHVVDGATEVTVRLTDKREFKAKVVGVDKRTDVALIKIDASGLPTVKTGDAEHARVGEWVVAVGSPFGFENTVTAGIISAKARRLPDENYVPFIQTDVAINPGNSGGPLFNLAGEVIGINSQIYSRSGGFMGISFAIPIDVAMKVKDQLQRYGKVSRGRLGVSIQGLDPDLAQNFGLDKPAGALIANVENGSPAEKAGLQSGDVVLGVNGQKVENSADLPRIIGEQKPGTSVRLSIWRDRKAREVSVTLGEQLAEGAQPLGGFERKNEGASGKLGLTGRSLTAAEASRLGVAGGLLVEGVNGPAAKAGMQPGDIILGLNNQPVTSVDQFRKLLEGAGNRFALLVQRGNSRIFLPIRMG